LKEKQYIKADKPIKRNAAIAELSKDHHAALLLIWNIRKGLKNPIEPERISKYVIQFYENDLVNHFKEEEGLLFIHLDSNAPLRIQAEDEHKQIHLMIEGVRNNPGDKKQLETFATALEKHIRFEERVLFNHLQEIIPETKLALIASALNAKEKSCALPPFPGS